MRYRLPDALGGHEVKVLTPSRDALPPQSGSLRVLVHLDDESFPIDVPATVLVVVKPPLPEPPDGSVVLVQIGEHRVLWLRKDNGAVSHDSFRWYAIDESAAWRWVDGVVPSEEHTLTPLVPDPFAEPVELPWSDGPFEVGQRPDADDATTCKVQLTHSGTNQVRRMVMTPQRARTMARALWAAANAADVAESDELPDWERELLEGQR